ncbi:MAG: hypothetical protein ACYCXW_22630 [Solirubrobacteraceae bacterium]
MGGCASIHDPATTLTQPAATTSSTTTTAPVADPVPAPERGGTIPANARQAQTRLAPGAAAAGPVAALDRYATVWSNWTASTVVTRQRQLAGLSLGQARAQALQAAATLTHDKTLAKSQVANTGTVIAIAPDLHQPGQWIVVTSEKTTGKGDYSGLPPTVHVTYAQLTHTSRGYVVSRWSPAS